MTSKRECGGCTVCCTIMAVHPLKKPAGVPCEFAEKGCTIYSKRPSVCKGFECHWLTDEPHLLKTTERPDLIGLMFHGVNNSAPLWMELGIPLLMLREVWKGASAGVEARAMLERMQRAGVVFLKDSVDGNQWLMYGLPEKVEAVKKWSRDHAKRENRELSAAKGTT